MAKLEGVLMTDQTGDVAIYYEGAEYRKTDGPAYYDDILRSDTNAYGFIPFGTFYKVVEDDRLELCIVDETGERLYDVDDESDYTILRRVSPQTPAEIRALIDAKEAEIAELETQLAEAERINVSDYVRLTGRSSNEDFDVGDIAQVISDDRSLLPFKLWSIVGNNYDWVCADRVVKITPAEAKAALISQVEEAFGQSA